MGYFQLKEHTNMKWKKFVELVTNDKIVSKFSLEEDFSYSYVYHTKRGIHFNA